MKNIPLTVAAPPPQDRTAAGTDEKEVARTIADLPPDKAQLRRLLKTHKAARAALKASKRDMIGRMRQGAARRPRPGRTRAAGERS